MINKRAALIAAVVLLVTVAAPAAAKKGGGKGKPTQEPAGGYTCAEMFEGSVTGLVDGDFSFTLDSENDSACFDVTAEAGVWNVTVTGSGARGLTLIPKDSYPSGDSCGGAFMSGNDIYGTFQLPLLIDTRTEIPASTVNACGTEYGEWIGGELVMEQTGNEHPLAFVAFLTGSRRATAVISVDLP